MRWPTKSRTQASDAMTSRLPRYEAKCVQRRCFQWGSVRLRSYIKGTELPPCQYIDTTRKAIDCATSLPLTVFSERSRSLFAVARPSVVCLSSVTFVRPTQAIDFFGNISAALGTLAIH